MIWNVLLWQIIQGNTVDYLDSIRLLIKNQPTEAKQLIEMMKERKKLLFRQYNYLFGEYKFRVDKSTGEIRLSMETRTVLKYKLDRQGYLLCHILKIPHIGSMLSLKKPPFK